MTQTKESNKVKDQPVQLKSKKQKINWQGCACDLDVDFTDSERIPLACPRTFEMLSRSPLGVFQLAGHTAKKWVEKFHPDTLLEISDFTSLDRPGCLQSGMMDEYINVKFGEKEAEFLHKDLEPLLGKTYGTLVYQEQIMEICWRIAGLSLGDADHIRKAVGKKKPDLMAQCKEMFINGGLKNGYTKELMETIWGWIDKFSGYGFNKAHAVCYAMLAYKTAWAKTHYPTQFYAALLRTSGMSAEEQTEEIRAIVNDAKIQGVEILPPSLLRGNLDFDIVEDKKIAFGLGFIKGIGPSSLKQVMSCAAKDYKGFVLNVVKDKVKKTVVEGLIWSGALDTYRVSRYEMAADFFIINNLTDKELAQVLEDFVGGQSIYDAAIRISDVSTIEDRKALGEYTPTKRRCPTIRTFLEEAEKLRNTRTVDGILAREKCLLGITVSGSETDLYGSSYAVDDCIEFFEAPSGKKLRLIVVIEKVRYHFDKNKNKMAFLVIGDASYMIEQAVLFASKYERCAHLIEEGRVVIVNGTKQTSSFIIDNVKEIR